MSFSMEVTPLVCSTSLTLAISLPLLTLALFLIPKTKVSKGKWNVLTLLPFLFALSLLSQCPLEAPFFLPSNSPAATNEINLAPSSLDIAELAYLATTTSDSSNFIIYDTSSNQRTYSSSLSPSPTREVILSLDGTRAYIAAEEGIHIINTATNKVTTFHTNTAPSNLAVSSDGGLLYTVGTANNNISIVDTSRITIVGSITVGLRPIGMAITPDGSYLYVANWGSNNVYVVDALKFAVVKIIPVGVRPTGIAISPDGTKVFVVNFLSDSVSVIDTGKNEVILTMVLPLDYSQHPQRVWSTPKGDLLYVSIWNTNYLLILKAPSYIPVGAIPVGIDTVGVAFTYNGFTAYSVSANSTIYVIDVGRNIVKRTIESVGGFTGIAIAYVF